eukprot:12401762-Karenia_brevis.AAC.1
MRVRTGSNVDSTTGLPPSAPAEDAPEAEPATPGESSCAEVAARRRLPEHGEGAGSSSAAPRLKYAPTPGARETSETSEHQN